jgi:hypothetical protein
MLHPPRDPARKPVKVVQPQLHRHAAIGIAGTLEVQNPRFGVAREDVERQEQHLDRELVGVVQQVDREHQAVADAVELDRRSEPGRDDLRRTIDRESTYARIVAKQLGRAQQHGIASRRFAAG